MHTFPYHKYIVHDDGCVIGCLSDTACGIFFERDTAATVPLWFQDRCRNVQWLSRCIGNYYQRIYLKITAELQAYDAVGILFFVSVTVAAAIFFPVRMGLRCLLKRWKQRWKLYNCIGAGTVKKCAMAGIAFMGFSISTIVVKLPIIPFKWNVVSWWILISGVMEFLYFYYDRHGF